MVIHDRLTAKANCSGVGSLKPPDRPQVTGQAAATIKAVKTTSTGSSTASVRSAKSRPAESSPPSATFLLNIGMKAAENAPSANKARNMLGRRKETKKASEAKPAPTKLACSVSRTRARTRLTRVRPATEPRER